VDLLHRSGRDRPGGVVVDHRPDGPAGRLHRRPAVLRPGPGPGGPRAAAARAARAHRADQVDRGDHPGPGPARVLTGRADTIPGLLPGGGVDPRPVRHGQPERPAMGTGRPRDGRQRNRPAVTLPAVKPSAGRATLHGMDTTEHLATLEEQGRALALAADKAGLDADVPTCPRWTVRHLLGHIGMVHRWAASHVREGRAIHGQPALAKAPADGLLD